MFRHLIPRLADRYRVIAPDYLGFGLSDAPQVNRFTYTFDALAGLTVGLLRRLGVGRYAMYVQDYGAPVGWRLALRSPESILAILTQNGNGYEAGFQQAFWKPVRQYWATQNATTEAPLRRAMSLDGIRWQYVHGVADPTIVSPDTWHHDYALMSRPGSDLIQLQLLADYASNVLLYPELHVYLRESKVPLLAVWGRYDEIFGPAGAVAFEDDAANAEVHLLDGGHFVLESHLEVVTAHIRRFLERTL
jgi:pimeloyl-ACP methyl ester carboxylesterase